jgi:hypothetical protein
MSVPPDPARIHVLLARDKPLGVVMRRGPSRKFCTLLWDLRSDAFAMGQWVNARLYPMRSDLSPDGRYLIYFALNGRWQSETRGSYTAISRAPHLKALTLYPKGDAWGGGGLWTGNRTYWLNHLGLREKPLRSTSEVARDTGVGKPGGWWECPYVYFDRLERDGWAKVKEKPEHGVIGLFEKPLGAWRIEKTIFFRNAYRCRHVLEHRDTGMRHDCADWEWAELRGSTILYAARGCLYRAKVTLKDGIKSRLVRDLTGMKFEAIAAPY